MEYSLKNLYYYTLRIYLRTLYRFYHLLLVSKERSLIKVLDLRSMTQLLEGWNLLACFFIFQMNFLNTIFLILPPLIFGKSIEKIINSRWNLKLFHDINHTETKFFQSTTFFIHLITIMLSFIFRSLITTWPTLIINFWLWIFLRMMGNLLFFQPLF